MIVKKIEGLCQALAEQIELAGIEQGVPFAACQSQYGVTWEYFADGGWIGHNNLSDEVQEIAEVRFIDCDGETSDEASDVCGILEAAAAWIKVNENYYCES